MYITKVVSAEALNFETMSRSFCNFFKSKPWNEHVMCSTCKKADDYGPKFSWGIDDFPTCCPICGSQLVPFWSLQRTKSYLTQKPNAFGVIAEAEEEIIAWVWGYPCSDDPKAYYIDTVAIISGKKQFGLNLYLRDFRSFLDCLPARGFSKIRTRTHKKAKTVRLLLRILGFYELNSSEEDPDRSYWQKDLNTPVD